MEQLKLNNEILQTLMEIIKEDIKSANQELEKIDVKDITLDDLIQYKSRIQATIFASKSVGLLYPISKDYFLASASMESMEQIKERMGSDNNIALAVESMNTSDIENRIKNINSILESDDYKDAIDRYNLFNSIQEMKNEKDNEQESNDK